MGIRKESVTMKEILKKDIFDILTMIPATRTNDNLLFAELVKFNIDRSPQYADIHIAVAEAFTNPFKYGLPNYNSVTRERLELQKLFPTLQDENTVLMRKELQEQYRSRYSKDRREDI